MRHISKGVRLAAALMALLLPASFAVSAETAQAQRIYTVVSQGNSGQIFKEPQESTFWESPVLRAGEAREDGILRFVNEDKAAVDVWIRAVELPYDDEEALAYLETAKMPIVLKADGLALGKGVLICNTLEEAKDGVRALMLDKQFGAAGSRIVVEEFMTGREVSVLSFVDGNTIKIMTSAQDHKRAKDGDQGLNTGGMGTFSPSPFYTDEVDAFCQKHIYQATVDAMKAEGREFKGIIFFGLMLTKNGPKVLEYNARFGDPETQVVLPLLESDLLAVMQAATNGTLAQTEVKFSGQSAACVVLASGGYPQHYEKGKPITGLADGQLPGGGATVYHAGTALADNVLVTSGGRVLGVTAVADSLFDAVAAAYGAADQIGFEGLHRRSDIGQKALAAL